MTLFISYEDILMAAMFTEETPRCKEQGVGYHQEGSLALLPPADLFPLQALLLGERALDVALKGFPDSSQHTATLAHQLCDKSLRDAKQSQLVCVEDKRREKGLEYHWFCVIQYLFIYRFFYPDNCAVRKRY